MVILLETDLVPPVSTVMRKDLKTLSETGMSVKDVGKFSYLFSCLNDDLRRSMIQNLFSPRRITKAFLLYLRMVL